MKNDYFNYLEALQARGTVNMFGAAIFLQTRFSLSAKQAKTILRQWMADYKTHHKDAS